MLPKAKNKQASNEHWYFGFFFFFLVDITKNSNHTLFFFFLNVHYLDKAHMNVTFRIVT